MWLWIMVGVVCLVLGAMLAAIPTAQWYRRRELQHGLQLFGIYRERLEARFEEIAREQHRPRDLRWVECDWQDDVVFACDRQTGLLTAFAAVNIRFEAIEGGDMEDVAAVGILREAAAVFHYQAGVWGTGGRALFNMDPASALRNLQSQYEPVTYSLEDVNALPNRMS